MADLRWLTRIGDFEVVRREIPRPGGKPYYLNGSTLIGVLHHDRGRHRRGGGAAKGDLPKLLGILRAS